jgi:hypothetical protein
MWINWTFNMKKFYNKIYVVILEFDVQTVLILNKSESFITWQGSFESKTKASKNTGHWE